MTVIYLTAVGASTWNVPADWNNFSNNIQLIGGGGGGSSAIFLAAATLFVAAT